MTAAIEEFIWHQVAPSRSPEEAEQDDRALMLAIPKAGDFSARLESDSQTIVLSKSSGEEVRKFKLYEKVICGPNGESSGPIEAQPQEDGTLVLLLLKQDRELWTQLVDEPIPLSDPAFVNQSVLDTMVQAQVPSLPTSEQEATIPRSSLHPITLMQMDNLKDEKEQIDSKLTEYKKQLATSATGEAGKVLLSGEKDEVNRRLKVLEALSGINAKLRSAMEKPTNVKQMLAIQKIEIWKARCNAGSEEEEEQEEFKDGAEAELATKDLNDRAMKSIQVKTKEGFMEGMRLLRLAALKKDDPTASIILFRLYNEMEEHGKAAYFLVRRAQMDDCEPMSNAMVGSMHDDGLQLFPPWTGMALYYYQRAAQSGRQCLMDISNVWRKGYSKGSEEIVKKTGQRVKADPERQMLWLQHSIARGSGVALFIKAQLHMAGDAPGYQQSKKLAAEAWGRALAAAPQLQQQQEEMEKMLGMMPNEGEAPPAGRQQSAPGPSTSAGQSSPTDAAYSKPDLTQDFGSPPSTTESSVGFLSSAVGQTLIVGVLVLGVVVAVPPVRRAVMGLFGK